MKKYTLIILSSLLLAFTSCNNWLDVELDNKIEDTKLFTSASGFKEALVGVYSELSKSPLYGQRLSMEYMDILAGFYSYNAIRSTYEDWKDYDYESSASASVISGIWNGMYSNIAQVNCILYWADENASMLSEADRNQIRGEALGLRAYLHFDLYRMFSPDVKRQPKAEGIPYNKEFGVSIPPMYTAEECVQLVINDLLEAEQCLQNDPIEGVIPYEIRTVTDQGEIIDAAAKNEADQYVARINLYAVKAMLARAYQARGEYDKAIEKAQEVIDCGKFRLLDFTSIDQTESSVDLLFSDEHVFSLRNQDIDSYSKDLHRDIVSGSGTQGTALPFSDTYSMYQGNNDDVRYSKWFDMNDFLKFIPDSANIYPKKMPMIKLSEMYLLIAECSFDTDKDKALECINILRDHRVRSNTHWQYLEKENIFDEMRREYVGEGQMWYAYKRNHHALPGNNIVSEIEPSDDIFVFPLPDAEIENGHRNER